MTQLANEPRYDLRIHPKDVGVLLIAALCLFGGWLLMQRTTSQTISFQDELTPLQLAYPAGWIVAPPVENIVLAVINPVTPSLFKTTISVENRLIDPANPPTLQTLLDRRIEQRQSLTSYHFLGERETTVDGARAIVTDYAYVTLPIDESRRAALPVVVVAREYIVITADQSYYITLAAPETTFEADARRFERMVADIRLQ
ncbi:MAG: hypothetical protein AB4911_19635 [Oscillochloridaceae bacterium umkhey_bin13]